MRQDTPQRLRAIVREELNVVEWALELLEDQLARESRTLGHAQARIDHIAAELEDSTQLADDVGEDFHFALRNLATTLRASLLLSAHATLEHGLRSFCWFHAERIGCPLTTQQSRRLSVRSAGTYLIEEARAPFPAESAEWEEIQIVSAIRNIFAHRGGRVSPEEIQLLGEYFRRRGNISFWGEHRIIIHRGYVEDVLRVMGVFVEQLE
jgi:hypothetical protein